MARHSFRVSTSLVTVDFAELLLMQVKSADLKLSSLLAASLFILSLATAPGCATRRTVTTTTEPASSSTDTTTTEITTPTYTNEDSVLGATGHFIWTVVSFPFRLIGDAFSMLV